jgi:hypothetical protein
MSNTCEGANYTCGETGQWGTGIHSDGTQTQIRNRKSSFMLGTTEIIVNKEDRNFNIQFSGGWSASPSYLMRNDSNTLFACGTPNTTPNTAHSVSESYTCINTTLYFLDVRYNNAICKEVTETITFSEASSVIAGFKETWGVFYYPKFVITNHKNITTIVHFIVLNGVKTVLNTTTLTSIVNGPTNPLILVYPNPPSLAIPWINVDDIKKYGFYDYHNVDDGSDKIKRDGGDDFYFTDWMRNIGQVSFTQDQADADQRYFDYYLGPPAPGTTTYLNPGITVSDTPVGSITQDADGNIFYSVDLGGKYNKLITKDGVVTDATTLFPNLGPNQKFFPVGLV